MKKIILKTVGILIALIIVLQNSVAIAATSSQLQNEKNKNNQQINETQEQIKEVEAEKSQAVKEVEALDSKIDSYESQISELETKISGLNSQINDKQNQLNQAQEDYTNQKELLEKRLIVMQEAGETSYLDFLLSSNGLADFISNYYLISEIADNDTQLLSEIKKQEEEIAVAKTELENAKSEVTTSKASLQGVQTQLKSAKSEKNKQIANLTEDEKQLQAKIDELNAANKEIDKIIQEQIRKAQQAAGNSGNKGSGGNVQISSPSAAGFILPIPVAYHYPITATMTYPSSGRYHGAYDFGAGGINGQPVYAVADGTVMISGNLGNSSYGNYILINHNNGLFTLYAHGQNGSRTVSAGQTVKQGQQIMRVGSTGNSTGPHLHFEVRKYPGTSEHAYRLNPGDYLPK